MDFPGLQDLMQWLAFLALLVGMWVRLKQRDKARDEITRWRTNIDRDIGEMNKRLDRHGERNNRIFDRLDTIQHTFLVELKNVTERLVAIETKMEKPR